MVESKSLFLKKSSKLYIPLNCVIGSFFILPLKKEFKGNIKGKTRLIAKF